MSLIPPISTPAAHIAGSAAGAQRRDAATDRVAEAGAEQRITSDRQDLSARSLGDVGQMDGSADRDADGRRYDEPPDRLLATHPADDAETAPPEPPRVPDASGDRGRRLDLDA
jgi:hypothetical protein